MSDGNVIEVDFRAEAKIGTEDPSVDWPVEKAERRYTGSRCERGVHRPLVDGKQRRVTCKVCGAVLDPIEVLLDVVAYLHRERWQITELRQEREKQEERRRKASERRERARRKQDGA